MIFSTLMRAISIFPRSTRVAISRLAALASASRFSRRILIRCIESLHSSDYRRVESYRANQLMGVVVSLWCKDGPDLDLVGGVRTSVQRSREGIIPAFDLEELHGTMSIQSPDVVQVNRLSDSPCQALSLVAHRLHSKLYLHNGSHLHFTPSSYYSLCQIN